VLRCGKGKKKKEKESPDFLPVALPARGVSARQTAAAVAAP
jgi:hypothetical protein